MERRTKAVVKLYVNATIPSRLTRLLEKNLRVCTIFTLRIYPHVPSVNKFLSLSLSQVLSPIRFAINLESHLHHFPVSTRIKFYRLTSIYSIINANQISILPLYLVSSLSFRKILSSLFSAFLYLQLSFLLAFFPPSVAITISALTGTLTIIYQETTI